MIPVDSNRAGGRFVSVASEGRFVKMSSTAHQ